MHLEIITPDQKVFSGEVKGANFPGSDGAFEVFSNHAPLISTLEKGTIEIYKPEGKQNIIIDGGLVEVLNNNIVVLAEAIVKE